MDRAHPVKAGEVLGIAGEVTLALTQLEADDASRLFSQRAAATRSGYAPTAEDEAAFVRDAKVTRIGEVGDIAGMAAFIVSPEGRFLHGSLIDADGGATKTI